jgi:hypothetical protein
MQHLPLPILRALSLAVCTLAAAGASAQTYHLRMATPGLKAAVVTPAPEVEPEPEPAPAVCAAGQEVFTVAMAPTSWSLPAGCTEVTAKLWGAGGGSLNTSPTGGAGGFAGGTLTLPAGTVLTLQVGAPGAFNTTLYTNSGGGLTAIWQDNVPLLVAGGGGGAGKTGRGGGAGQNGEGLYFTGKGATMTAPGQGGCGNSAGTDWAGGIVIERLQGHPSGDGGAGRRGGGAGCAVYYNSTYIGGAGGGGSNYAAASVQNSLLVNGSYATPGNAGDAERGTGGAPRQSGRLILSYR